ncbi:MAG: trypsin-like serine protease [Acidobacteriota bacterium]
MPRSKTPSNPSTPRRRAALCLAAACLLTALPAAARQGSPPLSQERSEIRAQAADALWLGAVDPATLLAEDEVRRARTLVDEAPAPLRFALPVDLEANLDTHGTWTRLEKGRLWRLEVHAPGATDLNFGFGKFRLPPGATLHVINPETSYYRGPYTHADERGHGQLWTPVIPGSVGVVELFVPGDAEIEPQLELTRVGRGYRDLFGQGIGAAMRQGSCNIDVVCPERAGWEDEIRAVGVYGTNGSTFCTGTLINNVTQDGTPYFLTANHCGINSSNDASVVVYWNYESPTCGQLSGGSLSDSTSGATLRASDTQNDMALLELDNIPDPAYNVYYAGWDARTSTTPQGSVGIHHPRTDEKALAFNDDTLTTRNSCIGSGGSNTHWNVDNWEQGTTEPGSSGSGLFDPATNLLVGYLSGGLASCSNTSGYDCYGKMSIGWSRGLSTWLDPNNTGTRHVGGTAGGCNAGPGSATTETVTYAPIPAAGKVTSTGFWVYYGIDGRALRNKLVPFGDRVSCTNTFFGGDPLPGTRKKCYLKTSTNWMKVMSDEWESFDLPAGKATKTYTRTGSCPLTRPCTNSEFGDPAVHFYKRCSFTEGGSLIQADEWSSFTIRWLPDPPLDVGLSCWGNYSGSGQVTCNAVTTGGSPPYTYNWSYSGTAQSWSSAGRWAYAYYNYPKCTSSSFNYFYVSVTDGTGQTDWASRSPLSCY